MTASIGRRWQRPLQGMIFVVSLLTLVTCGGGGPKPDRDITITGVVDDGHRDAVIEGASCRFVDMEGKAHASATTNTSGVYRLNVPANTRGFVQCRPGEMGQLQLSTFTSSYGLGAGSTKTDEAVNPSTTVVADIIRVKKPDLPESLKVQLTGDIESGRDDDLNTVVAIAERLFAGMMAAKIDSGFGGRGDDGGNPPAQHTVSGPAGDGADFSPLVGATCEFVYGKTLASAETCTASALDDLAGDGQLNRPDLATLAPDVVDGYAPDEIQRAFEAVFGERLGRRITTTTDEEGVYELPIPPDVQGYVRCSPQGLEEMVLGTYIHQPGTDQAVTPATTLFSTAVAPVLSDDRDLLKENFLADIDGLEVQVVMEDDAVSGFRLGPGSTTADDQVGLVAFSVTALFNTLYKHEHNLAYLEALDHLHANRTASDYVDAAFLEAQGVPAVQADTLAAMANRSIREAETELGTDLATAWSTGRLYLTVLDAADGALVPGATVEIDGALPCDGCGSQTNADGQITLTIGGLDSSASEVGVTVSGVPGFEAQTVSTSMVALASVDRVVRLGAEEEDTTAPTVAITQPAADPHTTGAASIDLAGTAGDDVTVTEVSWVNASGGSGSCELADDGSWTATGIALQLGDNPITVTARDAAGNEGVATLIVIRDEEAPPEHALSISLSGDGEGRVSQAVGGETRGVCQRSDGVTGGSCDNVYPQDTSVTLTAVYDDQTTWFDGWGGSCSAQGTAPTCSVAMGRARTVSAAFAPKYTLTVTGAGNGAGSVTEEAWNSIACDIDSGDASGQCSWSYRTGSVFTLTATPDVQARFDGWSGACSGTDPCAITLGSDLSVTARFDTPCIYDLAPASRSIAASGGTGEVRVTASAGCSWEATSNRNWLQIVDNTGAGTSSGTVSYRVLDNDGPSRSGQITIAGESHIVNQDAAHCSYSISPSQKVFGPTGGTGEIIVTPSFNGCTTPWEPQKGSNSSWISIVSVQSGDNGGKVTYEISSYTGYREGSIFISAEEHSIKQVPPMATPALLSPGSNAYISNTDGSNVQGRFDWSDVEGANKYRILMRNEDGELRADTIVTESIFFLSYPGDWGSWYGYWSVRAGHDYYGYDIWGDWAELRQTDNRGRRFRLCYYCID